MSLLDAQDDGHAAGIRNQIRYISRVLGAFTVVSGVMYLVMPLAGMLLLAGCAAGWFVLGGYYLVNRGIIEPVGDAIGRIVLPSGGSTPSVNQHSNIEAMVARGDLVKAAEAYRAVIASEPQDIVACEKLGQLALRELKDFELAIWAYREADRRVSEPKRQLGYALIIAGIYRDNIKDTGKAMVEIGRVLGRFPEAPNTAQLRAELDELKAHHFGAP
jgi:tetratricopeptide (TPR) repeat protein